MKTFVTVSALAGLVGFGMAGSGCDSAPDLDAKCMDACAHVLSVGADACRYRLAADQQTCIKVDMDGYAACTATCRR